MRASILYRHLAGLSCRVVASIQETCSTGRLQGEAARLSYTPRLRFQESNTLPANQVHREMDFAQGQVLK